MRVGEIHKGVPFEVRAGAPRRECESFIDDAWRELREEFVKAAKKISADGGGLISVEIIIRRPE